MKDFFKGKEKRYPLTRIGIVRMMWDIKQAKLAKINGYVSLVIVVSMFGLGFLSKEFFLMALAGKGIGKVASFMIG